MSQAGIQSRPATQMSARSGINLPQIQHPLSRLGNPDNINIRGSNSRQGRPSTQPRLADEVPFMSNLAAPRLSKSSHGGNGENNELRRSFPKIPRPFSQSLPAPAEQYELETKTKIPIFGAKADIASRGESRGSVASCMSRPGTKLRLEVDELEMILREKLKKNYYEIKKLFISNDPEGRGNLSREALHRAITSFLGRFLSLKHFNLLLLRLKLGEKQVIRLEEFHACLREPVSNDVPSWLDPINRQNIDKLTMTAGQVHAQLKEKARQRLVDIAELIPQMNPGGSGRILKPELRNALNKMLFFMDDDEFEKLWSKYDEDGYGVINGERLMSKLGISFRPGTQGGQATRKRPSESQLSPRSETRTSPRRSPRKAEVDRAKSLDVEKWLKDKFREGFKKMKKEFVNLDTQRTGEIDRKDFQRILEKFDLKLDNKQLNDFMARCSITCRKDGRVSYRDFLQRFQDRSEEGIPHKILANPKHRYNKSERSRSPGACTTITAVETKLMGMFQADFLSLLGTFHKIDRMHTDVISLEEFRAAIESRFGIDMSDDEFGALVDNLPLDDEGNVKYPQFMAQFDTRNFGAPSLFDAKSEYHRNEPEEPMETEAPEEELTPMDFRDYMKGRSNEQLKKMLKKIVRDRYQEVEALFNELDESNTGKLNQEMMYYMLKKLGVRPEITRGEISRLWDTFITTQNRMLDFQQFVRHFVYTPKDSAFPNAKLVPPKRGDSDFLIRSRKLNCASDMLEDNLRSKVDYRWNDLRNEFLGLDPYATGYITKEEFRDVLQELCVQLNNYELDMLCRKFDVNKDGRVSYIEFLKPFALRKQTHRYGNNMLDVLTHAQPEVPIAPIVNEPHKGLTGMTARLRQKLVGDWRHLRRAFKKLDKGNTGLLTVPEFRNTLKLCNIILNEEEIYHVMSDFDENMDGKINYSRFITETFRPETTKDS
ncbi:EF-hand calcium-binding domain-containing protein 6-like [Anneissia japonica]|uniref:EF-hand calcium-binding domain-containing protein 6-like n=1 Tax=Anneissia japonica TaxID=1529436 RepID=UPI001425B0C4|nr:EF-hand calcium-binding domain-containing protein 6-like [Anneissia japonica]